MVDYFLSGAIGARVDGASAVLGGPKQRCVLAVLLANHGTVVGNDRLIDCVWEEESPAKALVSLRSYIANLRRIINTAVGEHQRLESRAYGYQLNLLPADSVDLHRFESLVAAGRSALVRNDPAGAAGALDEGLALWRGDPFGEFAFREFAAPDVLRYAQLRTTAIEARFDAALMLGAGADLVAEIEAAVMQHPLQERLWGHLMLALYRAGRTGDALRTFDRARDTLDREIGTRPGEGLQTLLQKITEGSADLRVEEPDRLVSAPFDFSASTFVGRDGELRTVKAAVHAASVGVGGMTVVSGESGIGKTSLAQAAVDQARGSGVTVAWAGHPTGVSLPRLWTWIQLLRQLGTHVGVTGRAAVRRAAPGVVDALVPEWGDLDSIATTAHVAASGFALIEGIVTALQTLSSAQPLLLVVDDLHLADSSSMDALGLLAAQFPRLPIQVIGNWTYHGADRPMNRHSFERLMSFKATPMVHLGGIDRGSAGRLVDMIIGTSASDAVCDELWRQARGNPFYIKELARTLDTGNAVAPAGSAPVGLSEAVVGVVGRRLGNLEHASRRVLAAAAVVGPEFDVAELADIVDLAISTVQARLRPAYETGLLDEVPERPGWYRFSHGLVRDALLARLATTDRTTVHAAVATTRAAAVATAAYEDSIAAADHAWRAGAELNAETALDTHETVIHRALNRSAYDDIAGLAEHALQICGRLPAKPEQLERQAMLWLHLAGAKGILEGQTSKAATDAVQRAFEIGSEVKGRSFYGAVALQCLMLCGYGRIDESYVIATGLRKQYEKSGDPDIGIANDFAHAMVYSLRGDVDALIATGRHMMATFPAPESVSDPLHFFHPRVYCWMALGEAVRGDIDAMGEYTRLALELAQSRGDVFNILAAKLTYVECAAILGTVEGTAALADAVDREFCAAGGHQWGAAARIISVWARTLDNEDPNPAIAFHAFDELTGDGSTAMSPMFLCLLADIEMHHGRIDAARELLDRAGRLAEATGEHCEDRLITARVAALRPLAGRSV